MLELNRKILLVPLTVVVTSLYLFPFVTNYFPGVNTKMVMAGISLLVLGFQMAKGKTASIDKHLMTATIYGFIVSVVGLFSVVYNGATDYTYASYIVSMWVWLGGAYIVLTVIRNVHGIGSVIHVCNYIIIVCVCQCMIALLVDADTIVKDWVDALVHGDGFMGRPKDRMYGVGCALDVAGMKFAGVLIMISVILNKIQNTSLQKYQVYYVMAFLFISVVGSMIGRTTYIGLFLSFVYWCFLNRAKINLNSKLFKTTFTLLCCMCVLVVYLYNNNSTFYKNFRFAFEGFFSIVEKGYWETNSNNNLEKMVIWPDNIKTWIIGDGYFDNPLLTNPFYVGEGIGSYYMHTDIGYCRFIFYFGVIGLLTFMIYFLRVCLLCIQRLPDFKAMFILILIASYIIWGKVASDLFVLFAPFFLITKEENDKHLTQIRDF